MEDESRTTEFRRRLETDNRALRRLATAVHDRDGYPPRLPKDLGRFVASPEALAAFVAISQGSIVGHVCVNATTSPEVLDLARRALGVQPEQLGVVARLLVSVKHRRRGVASGLLSEALAEVARLGRAPILDVATHLEPAIALYESLGWRRLGSVEVSFSGREPLAEYVYLGPGWGEPAPSQVS